VILGIDAHCIRGDGGSITHLRHVLNAANPIVAGFSKVILWSGRSTLDRIGDKDWLIKMHHPALDGSLLRRSLWSSFRMSAEARRAGCSLLWTPGCSFYGSFRPTVAMSRNMLPFDSAESRRLGLSLRRLKFIALRLTNIHTYRRADGMIYLSEYARKRVGSFIGERGASSSVIPHGVETRFDAPPCPTNKDPKLPLEIVYVSGIDVYKHQWHVIKAVDLLLSEGHAVKLTLVGPVWPQARSKLDAALADFRGDRELIECTGKVSHEDIHGYYHKADILVYASSCENLPNILLEAMASGRPIACSSRGPMPEILRDAGVYFDPESPPEIADALRKLLLSPELRQEKAHVALTYSRQYSWERCANETFAYLAQVASRFAHAPTTSSAKARSA
jgi:glycosyltransferase involved in cell wall biosynthesis